MMAEYLVLWLSVSMFIVIGMLTNIMFFRGSHTHKKTGRHDGLDTMLFEASGK